LHALGILAPVVRLRLTERVGIQRAINAFGHGLHAELRRAHVRCFVGRFVSEAVQLRGKIIGVKIFAFTCVRFGMIEQLLETIG